MRPAVVAVRPPKDVVQLIVSLSSQLFGNSAGFAASPTQLPLRNLETEFAIAYAAAIVREFFRDCLS
jgi:hypothetical protein